MPRAAAWLARRAPTLAALSLFGLVLPMASPLSHGSAHSVAWLLDLAVHWQWLFAAVLAISTALAAVLRDRRWGWLLMALPLPWLTASPAAPTLATAAPALTVASVNIGSTNRDTAALSGWLAATGADVVALFEITPGHAQRLTGLADLPFRRLLPRHGPFGIALLSRFPLRDVEHVEDEDGVSHLRAVLEWQERPVLLTAWHPMPPLQPGFHARRDAMLRQLAAHGRASGLPAILAGDLNATPWSSAFAGLAGHGLRRASGLMPTWPAALRGISGIPIDQVLVSHHWGVVDRAVGPDIGSDHLPVAVRLARLPAE